MVHLCTAAHLEQLVRMLFSICCSVAILFVDAVCFVNYHKFVNFKNDKTNFYN